MYISRLSIRNYRNFRNCTLAFKKGVNTIIGENGCGKTNLMQAIRILIDENLPRTYKFFESDFNRSLASWKGHWIIIQLSFADLDYGDEAQSLAIHQIGNVEQFNTSKGSAAVFFRPNKAVRKKLFDYSQSEHKSESGLNNLLEAVSLDDYELLYTSRSNTDFSSDVNYESHVGNFQNIIFPDPENMAQDVYGNKLHIANLTKELACTFVKALRDVETDLRSYRENPLINLLRGKEKSIEIQKKQDIVSRIQELNSEISALDEVKDVSTGITRSLKSAVGEAYAPVVSIQSELPEDMEKLMQSLKLWVGDSMDETYQGRIWELSLGGANLIYLSTKLLEYEKIKSLDKIANFLLIEEPEAHIHTHIKKTLFERIPEGNTQVIISTHSTHISSTSKISSVNVLSKFQNYVEIYEPSRGLSEEEVFRLERYLDAIRSNLLFSKGVILVEGDAEQILIPALFRAVFGLSLDEIGVSLITIGSTGFTNIASIFHSERLNKHCSIVTDFDKSIISLPVKDEDDNFMQRSCRNSQISGEGRKKILDEFCKDNVYVDAFYADNTFEVQFAQYQQNHEAIIRTVTPLYSRSNNISEIKQKIVNPNIEVFGVEVLRLANKFGKGWFALLLSEHVNHKNKIPDYILEAIHFATPHMNLSIAKAIANKRFTTLYNEPYDEDRTDYKKLLREVSAIDSLENLVKLLNETVPNDDIIKFLAS